MRWHLQHFAYLVFVLVVTNAASATEPKVDRHVLVYGEDGRFAGWPANHGMWMWGDEILVGFSVGIHKDLGERHNIDRDKPEHHVLARSLDGGTAWKLEFPAEKGMLINAGGMRHGTTDPRHTEAEPAAIREPIDFAHPDFCITLRFANVDGGNSRIFYSYDRGHNWIGPIRMPNFGQPGVMARTDYIVNGPRDCHVFLTASKSNQKEGRVFCGRTTDGAMSWDLLSFVGPEPNGFAIMPSTVRLSAQEFVTAIRRREGPGEPKNRWIETWKSQDNGASWKFLAKAVEDLGEGNPPAMMKLRDGRLCLTYGVRKAPFEIQAKFSSDGGTTWSDPFTLQSNGGGTDLGYVRSVQRPDGKVVTVYYFQTPENPYRRIIAAIWDVGSA